MTNLLKLLENDTISSQDTAWQSLLIDDHGVTKFKELPTQKKAVVLNCFAAVQNLTLDVNFLDSIELIIHCKNVVNATVLNATTAVVEYLASHCPKMKTCDLNGSEDLMSEHAVVSVCLHCPDLVDLNVSGCKTITGRLLRVAVVHCPHLTAFNVQDCNLASRDIAMFSQHFRGRLHKFIYNHLCNLSLRSLLWSRGCAFESLDLSFTCEGLSDSAVSEVGLACPLLTSVSLYQCSKITDIGVVALVQATPLLTSLNLEGLDKITDVTLQAVSTHCPALQELYLNYNTRLTVCGLVTIAALGGTLRKLSLLDLSMSDDTLISIVTACSAGLTTLEVSYNKDLTDRSFSAIAPFCRSLTKIHLAYCTQVTDESLCALIETCDALDSVDVSRCSLLTDKFLNVLVAKHSRIVQLRLLCNHRISNSALKGMSERLHHLSMLTLADMHLSDDVLVSLLTNCKQLTDLDISINNKVTDETFKRIAPLCTAIRRLTVRDCDYFTNGSLFRLSEYCDALSFLDVSGCCNVTLGGLHVIRDSCSGSLKTEHDGCELIAEEEERAAEAAGGASESGSAKRAADDSFAGY